MIRVLLRPGPEAIASSTALAGTRRQLDEAEQHHLRVRRAAPGELVEIRDGAGLVGTGRLARESHEWRVELQEVELVPRPRELVAAVGAGDRERFAWLVEKLTELGVTAVVPLVTERSEGVATRLRAEHMDRLRRRALEAVKQCGAAWAPALEPPLPIGEFAGRGFAGHRWLADAGGEPPPASLGNDPVSVVVGPEGGLTDRERELLLRAGYAPTVLGPHTLRFETAAIAGAVAATTARKRGDHGRLSVLQGGVGGDPGEDRET